jgi:hypothetical protein
VLRINEIKERIQNYRLGSVIVEPRPTNVPIDELVKLVNLNITHSSPMDAYPMKRRSFHPSCKYKASVMLESQVKPLLREWMCAFVTIEILSEGLLPCKQEAEM